MITIYTIIAKITSLTCEHTLCNTTNINTTAQFQNDQSYMCRFLLQQLKHKHIGSLKKNLILKRVHTLSIKTNINKNSG